MSEVIQELKRSIQLAQLAYASGDFPVGAILKIGDSLFIEGKNKSVTSGNSHLHAEIDIINQAKKNYSKQYKKTLFVTAEPCLNCSKALIDFGVDEVHYIIEDIVNGGGALFQKNNINIKQYSDDELKKDYLKLVFEFLEKTGNYPEIYLHLKNKYIN